MYQSSCVIIAIVIDVQASLGPYAWEREPHPQVPKPCAPVCSEPPQRDARTRSPPRHKLPYMLDEDLWGCERTSEVFEYIEREHHMFYDLPKPRATAGQVLRHAANVFERLHKKWYPMTFKFGITHCAKFRWNHKPFGYRHGIEKFEFMLILYACNNPIAPAWLEAAMIDKYGGFPAAAATMGKW